MDPRLIDQLRESLDSAGYSVSCVRTLLGRAADDARQRGVFVPARRILDQRAISPLHTLVRLFLLGDTVTPRELDEALPTLQSLGALQLGIVTQTHEGLCAAALSVNPVEVKDSRKSQPVEWWIISDLDDQLRRGPARPDHVMGVGGATRSLIAQAPPHDSARSLDLGTGCGIVALHLSLRGSVVATDISERALMLARANARLNRVDHAIEFRLGSLFEPVRGEDFHLILSNPPFVITPQYEVAQERYEYRDAGFTGDQLAATVVQHAPGYLAPGGTLLCLGNWESEWGAPGLERVRGWVHTASEKAGPLASWVLERDRVDPIQYAETWARDGGARSGTPEFDRLIDGWIRDFTTRKIVAIGLGAIRVRKLLEHEAARAFTAQGHASVVQVDEATGALSNEQLGHALDRVFEAGIMSDLMSDSEVLQTRWQRADTVVEEREHEPGEESPRAITLSTHDPIARRVTADTLLAATVGVCDGELTLSQITDALATLLDVDVGAASEALVSGVRELTWLGMLSPMTKPSPVR